MRFLLRWSIKLSLAGLLYMAVTSGATATLADTLFGFAMPASVQQGSGGNGGAGTFGG